MNCKNIDSQSLLAYANILENLINSNVEILGECSRAVTEGFCEKEDVEKFALKAKAASEEADTAYQQIQKELDIRIKRDLGINLGIRKTQSLIKDFDAFVGMQSVRKEEEHLKSLSSMKKVEDDDNTGE